MDYVGWKDWSLDVLMGCLIFLLKIKHTQKHAACLTQVKCCSHLYSHIFPAFPRNVPQNLAALVCWSSSFATAPLVSSPSVGRCGTAGHGLAGVVVMGWWLHLMILEVFSNLNDSMIRISTEKRLFFSPLQHVPCFSAFLIPQAC